MANFPDQLASVLESRLPLAVESDGREDDWAVAGPALLVAACRHLRALEHLQTEFPSTLVGWQLLRSMYEYVTTYAWIAADPDDRAPQWLKSDYRERLKLLNDYVELGQELVAEDDWERVAAIAEGEGEAMPRSLVDRAKGADAAWEATLGELDGYLPVDNRSFRTLYPLIYRGGSRYTHPTTHGAATFVSGDPPRLAVGEEKTLERDLALVGSGILALGLAIATVAAPTLGISIADIRAGLS